MSSLYAFSLASRTWTIMKIKGGIDWLCAEKGPADAVLPFNLSNHCAVPLEKHNSR
jgi:hypothetical protein